MDWVLRFLGFLFSKISARRWEQISYGIGYLLFCILPGRRRLLRRNIRLGMGEQTSATEVDRIAISSLQSLVLTAVEFIESKHHKLHEQVSVKNIEEMNDILNGGRGCLMMSTHTGNWEALAASVCHHVANPVYVPVKKVGGHSVNKFVTRQRYEYGLVVNDCRVKGERYKLIQQVVDKGGVVGFMHDQSRTGSPRMDFMGHNAKTNLSTAAIWAKLDLDMVPVSIRRVGARKHELTFHPKLNRVITGNEEQDILTNSLHMNSVAATLIRSNPEQHLWLHNRWK